MRDVLPLLRSNLGPLRQHCARDTRKRVLLLRFTTVYLRMKRSQTDDGLRHQNELLPSNWKDMSGSVTSQAHGYGHLKHSGCHPGAVSEATAAAEKIRSPRVLSQSKTLVEVSPETPPSRWHRAAPALGLLQRSTAELEGWRCFSRSRALGSGRLWV